MADSQSKFGRQPFQRILDRQGRTVVGTAKALGFDTSYFLRVACGRTPPSDDMKQALVRELRLPVKELFTPDALESNYRDRANARGFQREDKR